MAMTRTTDTDDDGTGTTGTIHNNSWLQAIYDAVEAYITNLLDDEVRRPKFRDYSETIAAQTHSVAGALTLDYESGNIHHVTLSANATSLVINNWPASGGLGSLKLIVDYTGAFSITWPAAFKWSHGSAPTQTSANAKSDIFVLETRNGGTRVYAALSHQNIDT